MRQRMSTGTEGRGRVEARAAEVLDHPSAPMTARELLDLIHAVNPTGHELPAHEEARRYALKSRLQSLLIHRFGEELRAVPAPDREGVVSLRHRTLPLDACHAVIESLEEDARSWVRLQLDLGDESAARPSPRAEARGRAEKGRALTVVRGPSVEGLLQQGREALESYELEAARERFSEALDLSGGEAVAAVPLLELLVDQLAADTDACALLSRLSAEAVRDAQVRLLLGLAEARSGDVPRAARWIKGVSAPRVAEVLALLAERAWKDGDVEAVEKHLEDAKQRGVSHPELLSLSRKLTERRSEARGPLEQEVTRLLAAGARDEVEAKAQGLLQRFPDSAVARRVLAQLQAERRAEKVAAHREMASAAMRAGEPHRAAALLREALALTPDSAELAERLAEAERRALEQEDAKRAEEVVGLLSRDERAGLLAYARLGARSRRLVPVREARPALRWLDALGVAGVGARGAVDGVVLWAAAGEALERGEPALALSLFSGPGKVLEALPEAQAFVARARALDEAQRVDAARAALKALEDAFAAADFEQVMRLFAALPAQGLSAAEREAAEAQCVRADAALNLARRVDQVARLEARGAFLDARLLAEELAAAMEGESRAMWQERIHALAESGRRAFRLRVVELGEEGAPCEFADRPLGPRFHGKALTWLDETGERVVLASSVNEWIFIREVSVRTGRIHRLAWLRAPEPMGSVCPRLEGDKLTVFSDRGWVLELSWPAYEILGCRSVASLLSPPEYISRVTPIVGSRFIWMRTEYTQLGERKVFTRILDLEHWRMRQCSVSANWIQPVVGTSPPRVFLADEDASRATLQDGNGVEVQRLRLPPGFRPKSAALPPEGEGLLVAGVRVSAEGTPGTACLLEMGTGAAAQGAEQRIYEVGDAKARLALYTARTQGLSFALLKDADQQAALCALTPSPQGWTVRSGKTAPTTAVVEDARSGHVAALVPTESGVHVACLADGVSGLPCGDDFNEFSYLETVALLRAPFWCAERIPKLDPERDHAIHMDCAVPMAKRRAELFRAAVARGESAREIVLRLQLLNLTSPSEAAALLRALPAAVFSHPEVVMLDAMWSARDGRWDDVVRLLSPGELSRFDDYADHAAHLLGIAYLETGDVVGALRVWREGQGQGMGICNLKACIAAVEPLPESLPLEGERPKTWRVHQLRRAIREADACFARGDATGALRAVDRRVVFDCEETQSMARLAEAHLAAVAGDAPTRVRKAVALAAYLEHRAKTLTWALPLGGALWSEAKLAELDQRSRTWLDGDQDAV